MIYTLPLNPAVDCSLFVDELVSQVRQILGPGDLLALTGDAGSIKDLFP